MLDEVYLSRKPIPLKLKPMRNEPLPDAYCLAPSVRARGLPLQNNIKLMTLTIQLTSTAYKLQILPFPISENPFQAAIIKL